jgi:hypothetical protein
MRVLSKSRSGIILPAGLLSALLLVLFEREALLPGKAVASEDQVRLELVAHEEPRCGIGNLAPVLSLGQLDRAGARTFSFTIDCNAPFAYSLISENGALKPVEDGALAGSGTGLPYNVSTRIAMSGGASLADECASAALLAPPTCTFSNSGSAIAPGEEAQFDISWPSAEDLRLRAGLYTDRLTLTLSPRI